MTRWTPLDSYIAAVVLIGLPLTCWLSYSAFPLSVDIPWAAIALLTAGLIVGEALPVRVGSGAKAVHISFSGGFSLALVLVAPLAVAVWIQILAGVVGDFRSRAAIKAALFNAAMWAISYWLTSMTFTAVAGHSQMLTGRFSPRDLAGVLVAGVVYLLTNHGLVSVAIAFKQQLRITETLLENNRLKFLPYAMDLGLAPLTIAAMHSSLLLVPFLMLPVAVLHNSARLAGVREHEATHDVLTGLPNRALLRSSFAERVRVVDSGAHEMAVMLIDLDHFKEINDTLGHHVGDLLLCEVSRRLQAGLREGDIVARLGGDEFAVLAELGAGRGREEAENLAQRLVEVLEEPFVTNGVRIDVQGSVGIALAPAHGDSIDVLMSRADIALYIAKAERGCAAFYDPEVDERTPERLSLLGELREGIERDELVLHFQPKVDVVSDAVVGVEALVRWRHPSRGLLAPAEFIPLAENTGLIVPLTLAVLDSALSQTRRWLDRGWNLGVAVNLSVRHLTDLALPQQIGEALRRHGVPPGLLTLEVTESTIMNDPSRSAAVLRLLRELGVLIAVDDYGTGYSSLAYLRRLEIDELKIDRSFISGLTGAGTEEVIVRSTVELGHNLGLRVVAEGVEDQATWERLAELSCDVIQGYYLSRPLAAADFEGWLAGRRVSSTGAAGPVPAQLSTAGNTR